MSESFIHIHSLCMCAKCAQANVRICADSHDLSMLDNGTHIISIQLLQTRIFLCRIVTCSMLCFIEGHSVI